jgi:hypothetical protein
MKNSAAANVRRVGAACGAPSKTLTAAARAKTPAPSRSSALKAPRTVVRHRNLRYNSGSSALSCRSIPRRIRRSLWLSTRFTPPDLRSLAKALSSRCLQPSGPALADVAVHGQMPVTVGTGVGGQAPAVAGVTDRGCARLPVSAPRREHSYPVLGSANQLAASARHPRSKAWSAPPLLPGVHSVQLPLTFGSAARTGPQRAQASEDTDRSCAGERSEPS